MRSFTHLVWKPFDGVEPHCSMTFLEIFSSKKFSRVVVYCSVIKVPVVLFSRQLWYLIKSVPLCQELFYFSFLPFRFPLGRLQATACIGYHICKALSTVFFICFFSPVFSALPAPFDPLSCPRLFRLRVSGWHGFLRLFKAPSSATGAILSPGNGIVNVFSLFYLFQTIHTIIANTSILFIFYFISICILPVQDFKPVRISTFLRKYIWKGTALPDKQP